jgi:hypothetical protein
MTITFELVRGIFKGHLFPFTQRNAVEAAWLASPRCSTSGQPEQPAIFATTQVDRWARGFAAATHLSSCSPSILFGTHFAFWRTYGCRCPSQLDYQSHLQLHSRHVPGFCPPPSHDHEHEKDRPAEQPHTPAPLTARTDRSVSALRRASDFHALF